MRHFHFHGTEASNQFHYYGRSQLRTLEVAQSLVQINTFLDDCILMSAFVFMSIEWVQWVFPAKFLAQNVKPQKRRRRHGLWLFHLYIIHFYEKNLCNDFNTTCANSIPLIHTASLLLFVCNLSIKRLLSLLENQ